MRRSNPAVTVILMAPGPTNPPEHQIGYSPISELLGITAHNAVAKSKITGKGVIDSSSKKTRLRLVSSHGAHFQAWSRNLLRPTKAALAIAIALGSLGGCLPRTVVAATYTWSGPTASPPGAWDNSGTNWSPAGATWLTLADTATIAANGSASIAVPAATSVSTAFFNPAGQNPSIDLTVNGTLNATTLTMLRFSAFGGTRSTTLTVNPGAVVNVSSNLNLNDGTNPGGAATNSVTINVNGGTLSVNSLNPNSGTFGQGLGTNNRTLNITNGGRLEVTIFGQYTPVGGGGGTGLAGTRQVTLNGGTIANRVGANANFGANVPMTLGTSGINAFEATAGQTITYGGTGNVLSGAGGFNKEGTGTFILGGADTYTGLTNINAGVLQMTTLNALGSAATGTNVNAGGTLNINGLTGVAEPLTLSGSGAAGQTGALVNNSGAAGSVTSNITLAADAGVGGTGVMTLSGVVSGNAALAKAGTGTTILSGVNTYSGATNVTAGTLRAGAPANGQAFGTNSAVTLANTTGAVLDLNSTNQTIGSLAGGGTTGGNVTLGSGTLTTGSNSTSTVYGGVLSGTGALLKTGSGTQTLTATNTYTGNTTITAGTLQLGDGVTNGSIAGNVTDNATLALDPANGTSVTLGGVISGSGNVNQIGLGTTILTGSNTYTGGTTIAAGTLQLGNGTTSGSIVGNVVDNATLAIDPASGTTVTLGGVISGAGALNQIGAGTTILTGANTYSGPTNVTAGALYVNGNQSAATGLTSVGNGATLGGIGTIGGNVTIANGATLAPGNPGTAPGTLTIQGSLTLNSGSLLSYRLGQANVPGGPMNDLTNVGGNLTLAGTLNVSPASGGSFGPGVYRIFSYGGALTNNGLTLGSLPAGTTALLQTSVPNQVNLVNTTGLTLNIWDGSAIANKNNNAVDGGNGVWQNNSSSANDNWTIPAGTLNAPWSPAAFAVFEATPGTVTVDSTTFGQVTTSGMQFASNGYVVQGDALSLLETTAGSGQTTIRVGDGTASGASDVATIASVLQGNTQLVKTDLGTLVLTGANTYTGGTAINGGTMQVSADANLGAASGALSLDGGTLATTSSFSTSRATTFNSGGGTVDIAPSTTLTLGGVINGAGALTKTDTGTLVLTAPNTYTGGTTIAAGTLQLGDGVTNGSIAGNVTNNATLALDPANGTSVTLGGVISGSGNVNQIGLGTTILTGSNTYTGGTTIAAGTLQLGNGITNGSIVGNVVDNATLAIDPASGTTVTLGGVISGTGALNQIGAGTTLLTGANTYSGPTNVMAGALYVNGNQTAATGLTSVGNGATLGGIGTIGGNVTIANGATLVPGNPGTAPGTLTIQGALTLNSGSLLSYRLGQANVPGGPMNDLTNVGSNLTLAGALNITPTSGGAFDPGVYRIVNYGGTLTNNGLALGTTPPGTFFVQTSVPSQVNLVNATGLTLNFWDGAAIANKNNSAVDGGSGIWQGSSGNDNWTASSGALNAPWASAAFAVFEATPGTVTVDSTTFGQVTTSGIQFASNGYVVQGDALSLLETTAGSGQTTIRVGDGTASGASDVATIASVLQGNTQLVKTDLGTLVLTGANTYTGGTVINGGTMQVSADANLGAASGVLGLDGGTLATTSSFSTSRATTLNSGGGTVDIAPSTTLTLGGVINGAGALTKTDTGTLVLTAPNTYTGGTTIAAGTLQLGDGVTNGSIAGNVTNNAILALDPASGTSVTLGGVISGSGIVNQIGAGTTVLAGANTYSGPTNVMAGALYVNGNQSAATGGASVDNGATLGGIGTIGGNVTINGGATLAPGNTGTVPGTLTIQGDLTLDSGSRLSYRLGQANVPGGPINDLTTVLGNLTLAGTLNITPTATGSFGPGLYRIVNYGGALTNNTLTLGSVPAGTTAVIQTSTPHEVNLVNITGLRLNVWDGAALANKNNNIIDGGDGAWQGATGNDNWTTSTGDLNAPWSAGAFALFQAAPGTVSVDNTTAGQVAASGAQFASNGYVIQGDALDLVETTPGSGQTTIRVGDGTAAGASDVATIASVLQGNTQLVKTDLGTLVLTAANTYTGGTAVNGGTVQVSADANLGASTAPLSFDGGTLATTASFSSNRLTALNAGGGTIGVAPNITLTLSGAIDGVGALSKANAGTLVLTAANTYTGGTTITSGTLQLGDGSTKGSIVGDVFDAGMLTFNRSDTLTFGGIISGTGGVNQIGTGTTLLTGSSMYSGATTVQAGRWAAGATNVFSPNSVYDVGPNGVLDLQSFDETVAGVNNAGLVRIARDPGAMLTTTNYVGQGGTLALNTTLGDDASPTDHLVINGGSASGTSVLAITNINGPGAATISNGIPVIQAGDGGTTAPGAFVLASGELRGGFYSYRLFRGGLDGDAPESWFLRSTFVVSQPPSTQPPSSSPPPGNVLPPDPPSTPLPPGRYPILGPEPATYSVVQPLARMQGLAMLGTLHERIGDTLTYPYATDDSEGWRRSGWGRVVAQQIDNRYRSFTAPQADGSVAGLQTGLDLWRGEIWPGFDALGVYFAYSHSDVDANGLTTNASATDYVHGHTGTARLNGYSGGGYWTHYGATGWYVDGVVQGTHYDGPAKTAFAHLSVGGWGWATSLEAGYPMKILGGAGFVVEPQAQVVWQRVNLHDGHDGQSDVALGSTNGVSGRLGVRGQWTVRTQSDQLWQPYIRLNVWRDAGGEATTVYAGTGRVPLAQQATRIEAAVGTTAMLAHGISLYGQVGYQHSVNSSSDGTREGAWGNAGLRYNW